MFVYVGSRSANAAVWSTHSASNYTHQIISLKNSLNPQIQTKNVFISDLVFKIMNFMLDLMFLQGYNDTDTKKEIQLENMNIQNPDLFE